MTQRAALIYNPSAGGGKASRRRRRVEACLAGKGIGYDIYVTSSEEHLVETARKLVHRYHVIIGAGGDTTINIIATEIIRNGRYNVLGIIALGSVNDLARELKVHRLEQAVNAIHFNINRAIDVGSVTSPNNGKPSYFLVSASLGLGVLVNRYVDIWMRKHPFFSSFRSATQGTAAMSGIHQAFKNKEVPMEFTLETAADNHDVVSPLVVFSNTASFGGNFRPSPTACLQSGKLDCCIFNADSFVNVFKASMNVRMQKHLERNYMSVVRDTSFKLHSGNPLEFQLDGEITLFDGEAEVTILPGALNMLTGPEYSPNNHDNNGK